MQSVEPIRSLKDIQKIKNFLKTNNCRDYLLFLIGINSGLRISDLLNLKVSDVKNKKYIEIKEIKTGKYKRFPITKSFKKPLDDFIINKEADEWIFSNPKYNTHISRVQAYRIIKKACLETDIKEKIGTHSLRKTFGYHFYQRSKDIALLQYILNHSSPQITLRYIGINQDIVEKSLKSFCL